jgi:hypothetical protein
MSNESTNTLGSTQGNTEVSFVTSSAGLFSLFGESSTLTTNNEFFNMVLTSTPAAQGNSVYIFTPSSTGFLSSFTESLTTVANNEFTIYFGGNVPVNQGNIVAIDYGNIGVSGVSSYQLVDN